MTYDRDVFTPCPGCGQMMPSPDHRRFGKCETCRPPDAGAGGGQAGGCRTSPKGDLPVDAPGLPSASDLDRYFCGPYCQKHGFGCPINEPKCRSIMLGLHTRDPRTKVDTIYYCTERGIWFATTLLEIEVDCPVGIAADLLVMGTVRELPLQDLALFMVQVAGLLEEGKSWPEAVAIAMHRAKDAEEQG